MHEIAPFSQRKMSNFLWRGFLQPLKTPLPAGENTPVHPILRDLQLFVPFISLTMAKYLVRPTLLFFVQRRSITDTILW